MRLFKIFEYYFRWYAMSSDVKIPFGYPLQEKPMSWNIFELTVPAVSNKKPQRGAPTLQKGIYYHFMQRQLARRETHGDRVR